MDSTTILTFTLAASLLVMSPGPNGVLIAKTVPTSGRRADFANVAGFLISFYLHGMLAVFGISALLVQSAELFFLFKIAGAVYLFWIGVQALRGCFASVISVQTFAQASERQSLLKKSLVKAFTDGFLTNALNPKVSMFYLAAFPQFISLGDAAVYYSFVLVFIHSTLNAVWFSLMVVLVNRLSAASSKPRFKKWLKGVTGVVFIGFSAKLITLENS